MSILKRLRNEERGATIVIVALSLTVLLGMAGAVTDVGVVYSNKWKMSNAIDAAVLAGAQELPKDPNAAKQKAIEYAVKNGLDPNSLTVNISDDKTALSIEAVKNVNLLFAQALGYTKSRVQADATARVGPLKGVTGAAPLGIEDQTFIYGEQYVIKSGDSTYGWFGPLSLGGTGASTYKLNLEQGYSNELKVGDTVPTETGNMSGPTQQGIEYRISACTRVPPCTFDNFERDCPQVLYIPVIKPEVINGNQTQNVKIVGFAAFFVDSVSGSGKDSVVTGYFVNTIKPGDIDFSQTDYGLRGVKLIK